MDKTLHCKKKISWCVEEDQKARAGKIIDSTLCFAYSGQIWPHKTVIIVFLLLIVYIKIHIRFVSALKMFNQYTTYSNWYSTNGSLIHCVYTIDTILILDCQPIVDWWSVDMSVDYTRLMHEQYPDAANTSIDDWHLSNISIIDMLTGTWPICRPIHCT